MIYGMLTQTWNGSRIGPGGLSDNAAKLLQLYPDDPVAGFPHDTGTETFGIPGFKRMASIREYPLLALNVPSKADIILRG